MSDRGTAFECTNRRSTNSLQFYHRPSAKRYPEQRIKWVTAMRREKWVAQVIKNYIYLSGAKLNDPLHIMFQMYSHSLTFQQNKPKHHSNGMNEHKNVFGDQT